jgi:hypothetical protein
MVVMKQIEECLERAFSGKAPLPSKKWKAVIVEDKQFGKVLYLFHYHHQILIYIVDRHQFAEEWWEKQADKRGLDSAKEWLEERWRKQQETPI